MPSRISGACNGCRTKKQKCSGDRAGCSQCISAGISCTWPEQRKRGPAKGYIEGLEHRLHEAETLLLALLPLVTPAQLSRAAESLNEQPTATMTGRDSSSPSPRTRQYSPPNLNKKTGIEYWESFPLDTVENIRRWQQDCALHNSSQHDVDRVHSISRENSHRTTLEHATSHSRPTSVDLNREQFNGPNPHVVFRAMSDASYRSRTATPVNMPITSSLSMPNIATTSNSNSWSHMNLFSPLTNSPSSNTNQGTNHASSGGDVSTEALLLQSFADQSWASVNNQNSNMGMAVNADMGMSNGVGAGMGMGASMDNGPMEIDTGFFANDIQRRLFW